jgi:putative transposase
LSLNRTGIYYQPVPENAENLKLMRIIDEQFMATPFYGTRQMMRHLIRQGFKVSRKRVKRLMRTMGLQAIYQKPRTSEPNPEHKIYPYLLRELVIDKPGQVWCTDITYIPMRKGFLYLIAVMDWYSRKVLSWRLSNTMDKGFCIEALEEAIQKYGSPGIFNTDQGSQFTSMDFINILIFNNIKISMDGKGRWMDNVFIERLWRSLKYECVYLLAFESGFEARKSIGNWIDFYNTRRPHSTFDGRTPFEVYNAEKIIVLQNVA